MGRRKIDKKHSTPVDWKAKSIKRGKEVKALNKRIRELETSRDGWKAKYNEKKRQSDKMENELNKIKKKLNDIIVH